MVRMDAKLAYRAMFRFLEKYWERGRRTDEDIAALLGSMSFITFSGSSQPTQLCGTTGWWPSMKSWLRKNDALMNKTKEARHRSASGRLLTFMTVRDFSALATCYAELNGRDRPKADLGTLRFASIRHPSLFASVADSVERSLMPRLFAAKE